MAKHVFTRAQYLDILNDSLRKHPGWQPGMAFVFLPPGADAGQATAVAAPGRWRPFRSMRKSSGWLPN